MFWSAGKILDAFIPVDKLSGKKRGFTFVRFGTLKEAEYVVELARGRKWRGRKIQDQLAKFKQGAKDSQGSDNKIKRAVFTPFLMPARPAWNNLSKICGEEKSHLNKVGWAVRNGASLGVRLASNVISEVKTPGNSLWWASSKIGFWKYPRSKTG